MFLSRAMAPLLPPLLAGCALLILVAFPAPTLACSEFVMRQDGYTLSARTEDFSGDEPWYAVSIPKGAVSTTLNNPPGVQPWTYVVQHGYVAFMENSSALEYLSGAGRNTTTLPSSSSIAF
jgi:hypothetical protein